MQSLLSFLAEPARWAGLKPHMYYTSNTLLVLHRHTQATTVCQHNIPKQCINRLTSSPGFKAHM